MLKALLNNLTKKKRVVRQWVEVRWSQGAVENGLGHAFLKEIYFLYNGHIYRKENYSAPLLEKLRLDGMPVLDKTRGEEVPMAREIPTAKVVLGRLQFSRRVY